MRFPRGLLLPLMVTTTVIGFVGVQTNIWVGLFLFLMLIVVPTSYAVYVYYMGPAMTMRGDLQGAIDHYTTILRLPVNQAFVYTRRAALKNAVGDIDGAIADYTAAMKHSGREVPALYGIRSALYLSKREYEEALSDSNRLLELQPGSEVGFANRAAARMFLGDVEGAIADCDTALSGETTPSGKALLYNNRGTAHRIRGDYGEAMSNYNLAMSASLGEQQKRLIHPSVMTNQGILYYLMEEFENARVYFQQAFDLNDSFYKAMAGLAVARFKLGQDDAARKLWKDLMALEPRYRDPRVLQRDMHLPLPMMADIADLRDAVHI